jgi:predicted transcriptional regulator YheO
MDDPEIAAINKNKEIVIRLEEKGIFNIKDAVVKVADQLEISKNTVYMHLRNLRK